jgi:hypothetical protein
VSLLRGGLPILIDLLHTTPGNPKVELSDILSKLQNWFPVEDHKERQIKGGGKWYYIPHQAIRDRLNEICPDNWTTAYEGPHLIDGEPVYHCRLTICGVTRTGIGDKSNEPSSYGTAAQRAFRKAFVDAAEQFGIGAYLDEQTSEKTKRNFIKYMQSQGNGKAAVNYLDSHRLTRPSRHLASTTLQSAPQINEAQLKRLWTLARSQGGYTDEGMRELLTTKGFASSRDITIALYDEICTAAGDPVMGSMYNDRAAAKSGAGVTN